MPLNYAYGPRAFNYIAHSQDLFITPASAAIGRAVEVSASSASLSIQANDASISTPLNLSASSRSLTIAENAASVSAGSIFPLSVSSNGRYIQDVNGDPFLIHGDTPWSIAAQLTDEEITTYLEDRADKGFTAILFNAIEHYFTSNSPLYENVDGVNPFNTMTDFASGLTAYWNRVDHIVNTAKSLNMVCIINPAYLGYAGHDEGWDTELLAESNGDLQTYGAALANRYTQGNIIWCVGGDADPNGTLEAKQYQIITGIRSVRTTDIITGHGAPGSPAYDTWNGSTGFNLNTAYPGDGVVYSECLTEYARSGPIPFLMLEAIYEQERGTVISAAGLRRQAYQGLLSGACGQFFGNNPIWHFESPNALYSYSGTWESNLDSTGSTQQQYVAQLFQAFNWHLLVPKTDTSLVTTSLGTGDSRICPALASDGSFAFIWKTASGSLTVDMTAFTPSPVRARFYNTTDGTYSTVSGSPFANTGTQSINFPGERVLVMDAAPSTNIVADSVSLSLTTYSATVEIGNTIVAASASQTHVAAAIASASAGDTVQVPAGSATWSSLTISKAIHLVGNGIGSTNITLGTSNSITKQAGAVTYIRGFSFSKSGGGNSSYGFVVNGSLTNKPVVIEDCDFDVSSSALFHLNTSGGVIVAKCSFNALWDDSLLKAKNTGGFSEWRTNDTLGTNDSTGESNFYIEDCYFYGGTNQGTDFDDGARAVFRYNRCDYMSFNSHGLATSALGVRHWEIYNNQFRNDSAGGHTGGTGISDISNQNWAIWIRGGTGVIFNNVIDNIANSYWGYGKSEGKFDIRAQQDNSGSAYGINSPPTAWTSGGQGDYPRQHQLAVNYDGRGTNSGYFIDPIYIWGNTGSGTSGGGLLGFANGGSWGSQTGYFNSSRDYFNGGSAKPGYTSYTYPHPLRQTTGQAF